MIDKPCLKVFSASWPGTIEPWRARFIRDFHEELSSRFETEILAPAIHPKDSVEEQDGPLSIRRFRYFSSGKSPRSGGAGPLASMSWVLSARRSLKRWSRSDSKNVILVHWAVPGALLVSSWAKKHGIPVVVWCHGSDVHVHGRKRVGSWFLKKGLQEATKVLAVSADMAQELEDRHQISGVEVLPVGIDPLFREPGTISRKNPGLQVLYVGERIESKGYGRPLRAVQSAVEKGLDVRFHVIGEGPMTGCGSYEPILYGAKDLKEVRRAMDSADLLLLPSHGEGTPLVVQEAIARQLPVAATPVGGIPDLFRDESGWFNLSEAGDVAIEKQLTSLLRELTDRPELLVQKREDLRPEGQKVIFREDSAHRMAQILCEVMT